MQDKVDDSLSNMEKKSKKEFVLLIDEVDVILNEFVGEYYRPTFKICEDFIYDLF